MSRAQLEELEKHGMYLSSPRGVSMWPMIRQGKDIVEIRALEKTPKRYDLVMYSRTDKQGVIHRVLYKKEDIYVICGDNCHTKEYVKPEQIKGIVTRFYRDGKWHSVTEKPYLLYVHLWTDFFFIRQPLFYIRDKLKRFFGKRRKSRNV